MGNRNIVIDNYYDFYKHFKQFDSPKWDDWKVEGDKIKVYLKDKSTMYLTPKEFITEARVFNRIFANFCRGKDVFQGDVDTEILRAKSIYIAFMMLMVFSIMDANYDSTVLSIIGLISSYIRTLSLDRIERLYRSLHEDIRVSYYCESTEDARILQYRLDLINDLKQIAEQKKKGI